jgi:hypothetical protein
MLLELIVLAEERNYGLAVGEWIKIQRKYDTCCMLTSALISTSDLAKALKYAQLCRDVRLEAETMQIDKILSKSASPFRYFQLPASGESPLSASDLELARNSPGHIFSFFPADLDLRTDVSPFAPVWLDYARVGALATGIKSDNSSNL